MIRHAERDRGLTLTELLIVVSLMGILAVVIASTFVVVVRASPANEARSDDARTLLGLSTWLPEDVSSTPPGTSSGSNGFAAPGTDYICAGSPGGTSLLHLRHSDANSGTTYARDYVLTTDASGRESVVRHSCVAGGPASLNNVTGPLSDPATCAAPAALATSAEVVLQLNDDGLPIGVEFNLLIDCGVISVQALSNNPAEDPLPLPDAAPTPSSVETTTTTTTTTTIAPPPTSDDGSTTSGPPTSAESTTTSSSTTSTTTTIPCSGASITGVTPNNRKVSNGPSDNVGHLRQNDQITITVNRGTGCPRLGFEVDTLRNDASILQTGQYNPTWIDLQGGSTLTIRPDDFLWSDGFHTLLMRNGSTGAAILASVAIEVTP